MRWLLLVLSLSLCLTPTLAAQEDGGVDIVRDASGEPSGIRITGTIDFPIEYFLKAVAQIQNKKFMLQSNQLQGRTVTIIAPGARGDDEGGLIIPRDAFFSVLQTMLKTMRMILAPFGEDTDTSVQFYEIVNINDAMTSSRAEDIRVLDDISEFEEDGAGFVTLIAHLKYAEAAQVRAAFANFSTRNGGLMTPIAQGVNALVIADYAYNVRRIAKMIKLLDKAPEMPRLETININYMDAEELSVALQNLLDARRTLAAAGSGANAAGRSTREDAVEISVAPNINALMVQGYDQGIEIVRDLVKRLDVKVPGMDELNTGRLHIYSARNVEADRLAEVLENLLTVGAFAPIDPTTGQPRVLPGQTSSQNDDEGPVFVTDPNTNSLIIIARPGDYAQLLKILQKIDVRRAQVNVEAAILEVRENDSFRFGVEIATVDNAAAGSVRANGATSFGLSTLVDSSGTPVDVGGGTPAGRFPFIGDGGLLALTAGSAFEIPLLVRFLKQQSDINVLSVPSIMVTLGEQNEEEEAEISVTTVFPTQTLSQGGNSTISGAGAESETGITLQVTPRVVSEDDYITLEVSLEVSNFTGSPVSEGLPPPSAERNLRTVVTVPNGNTIAIGGLTSTESSIGVSKIPFLGDIPFLGELFKSTNRDVTKNNLYVFLRPQIYRDPGFEKLRAATSDKLDIIERELEQSQQSKEWFDEARRGNEARRPQEAGKIERHLGLPPLPELDD